MRSRYDAAMPGIDETTVTHCHQESIDYEDYGWQPTASGDYRTTTTTSNRALRELIEEEKSKINCCMRFFKSHAAHAANANQRAYAELAVNQDEELLKRHKKKKPSVMKLGLGLLMSGHAI